MDLPSLLEDIRADIDNPAPYLVLADWLQESGQPWGELIVLQNALAERPGDAGIGAAIEALIKKNDWVPKHKPDDMRIDWRWGFIHRVHFFDRFDRNDLVGMSKSITKSPLGQLVRDVHVFGFKDTMPAAKHKKLAEIFPTADVGYSNASDFKDLEPKQRATARSVSVGGTIPKDITDCKSMAVFSYGGQATSLPASLAKLPIERLEINWCGRLETIPDALWGLESLGYISMYDCVGLGLNMGQVNNLLAGFIRSRTPSEQRIFEAALLRDEIKAPKREQLLFALDNNVKDVRNRALAHLEKMITKAEAEIEDGSVVAMIGSFNLDKKTLKKLVTDRGGVIKTKIDDKTTHVLVGVSPKGKQHDIGKLPIVLERHLTAKGGKKKAGNKAATGKAAPLDIAKLSKALRSGDNNAISAAVKTLAEHGEIPSELLPELFCILQDTKLGKKGKARAEAKKLFAALAPAKLRTAVSKNMKTSVLLAGQTKQCDRLTALEKAAGSLIDMKKLARLLVEDYQEGFKFLESRGDKKETDWAIGTRIKAGKLDLRTLELKKLPDLSAFDLKEIDLCGNHFGSFPKELAKQKNLTKLDLSHNYLRTLPKKMSEYKKLKVLDLSCNRFEKFPLGVVSLPALQELDLGSETYGETRITEIPPEIAELGKTLVTFRIENNRVAVKVPDEMAELKKLKTFETTWEGASRTPPAALKKLLPGVKIK